MDPITTRTAFGAAGAGGGGLGIEEVFSTWLYTGNDSTQTITNGIDLSGEGGMVWLKDRTAANSHYLYDTARGATKFLRTNATSAEVTNTDTLTAFNSNGFSIGVFASHNTTGNSIASWTFRKAPGFFDVVTYTGNGNTQTIAHSLGSVPGTIIIKSTNLAESWAVYHRSEPSKYGLLNSTSAFTTSNAENAFGNNSTTVSPTDTHFTVGALSSVNNASGTYVAYLFAHDDAIFGEAGDQSVIKCGSYTGNGSTSGPEINLGWEPQWVLTKCTSISGLRWMIIDNMRGMSTASSSFFSAETTNAEVAGDPAVIPTATGYRIGTTNGNWNAAGGTHIYIAIRRGPMKTPTSASEVFDVNYETEARTTAGWTSLSGFVDDAFWMKSTNVGFNWEVGSRLTVKTLSTNTTAAEQANQYFGWDTQDGIKQGTTNYASNSSYSYADYHFRRAPGFFDVVAYTGQSSTPNHNVPHNLGVAPELIIFKRRSGLKDWWVYSAPTGTGKVLYLNVNLAVSTDANFIATTPTATEITTNSYAQIDNQGDTYIAYLFATLPGISKVGSYTGTGTTQDIDCGFTAGARFVLIKRTDSTGDWYVWDTARGIISGNDPYLLLNSDAAEVTSTDYIDPLSTGFQISSTAPAAINANGGNFIFLAIA